jgi:hypothetical protein
VKKSTTATGKKLASATAKKTTATKKTSSAKSDKKKVRCSARVSVFHPPNCALQVAAKAAAAKPKVAKKPAAKMAGMSTGTRKPVAREPAAPAKTTSRTRSVSLQHPLLNTTSNVLYQKKA